MFAEQKALLEQRLEESDIKYKNRESRPEDVARIKKLAELCQEKDAAIKKLGVRAPPPPRGSLYQLHTTHVLWVLACRKSSSSVSWSW